MQISKRRFAVRFKRGVLLWVLSLTLVTHAGCESASDDSTTVAQDALVSADGTASESPGDLTQAKADYAIYCALCHGVDGEGYAADQANALNNPEFLAVATDDFLRASIRLGRPGTSMSAWHADLGGPLDDEAVEGIVTLIRSWQTAPTEDVHDIVVTGVPERVETLYELNCQSCHGEKGSGGIYMSIANSQFLAAASDGFLQYAIAKGRSGTAMPGFDNTFTPQQIDDLVALIRSWQETPPDAPEELPVLDPDTIVMHPDGPDPGFAPDEDGYISVEDFKAAYDANARFAILDARPPVDYVTDHISGAVSIPFYTVEDHLDVLPKDTWIVAYCACPHAESGIAADTLRENGYTLVTVIDEGYDAWKEAGYPITSGATP